jgi:hypothetical protein
MDPVNPELAAELELEDVIDAETGRPLPPGPTLEELLGEDGAGGKVSRPA